MKKILPAALLAVLLVIFAAVPMNVNAAIYQQGVVYVIYDATGEAAPQNPADLNANGVPDIVEDIATQVNAARELFHGELNFPDPLKSERFKGVTSIEIDIQSKERMTRDNGKSFTGMAYSKVRKNSKHNPNEQALHFRIANTVDPRKNSAPTHEYFHLIQYSSTYFQNKWFLEGMARWSQDAVSKINKYPDGKNVAQILNNETEEEQLFRKSYGASKFLWYPLAVNMNDKVTISPKLVNKYRYVNGSRVFHDDVFYGPNVMLKTLQVMKANEEFAATSEQFANVNEWRQKGRGDARNNKIIMDCVREVYNSKN